MTDTTADPKTKKRALIGLGVAFVITVGSWFFINTATNRGLERLQLIDRVWKVCESSYATAKTSADTAKVDAQWLSAAVDSGKVNAPLRCVDMRRPPDAEASRDSATRAQGTRNVMPTRTPR